METLVHAKPTKRCTWAGHVSKGLVLGTSPEHYICWRVAMEKHTLQEYPTRSFLKHKYLTNPAVIPADAILAAAADLASQIQGHNTHHLGRKQLHDLTNLQTIFTEAASTNAADAMILPDTQPADCRVAVAALRAEDAAGPKGNAVIKSSLRRRHALTTTSPPRAIPLPREMPHRPTEVPPLPRVETSHLPAKALTTAPCHRLPTTCAASRQEPPRRSKRPLSAASTAAQPTSAPPRH